MDMDISAELKAYIEEMNAKTRAWIAEGEAVGEERWAGEFHTDMDMWSESGVRTVEDFNAMLDAEFEREMQKSAMYDWDDDYPDYEEDKNYLDNMCSNYENMNPTHFEHMANAAGYLEY